MLLQMLSRVVGHVINQANVYQQQQSIIKNTPVSEKPGYREIVWDSEVFSDYVRKSILSHAFREYIGNNHAVKRLARVVYMALGRKNHVANDQYFALIGPASTGKTTLAKMYATALELPFVEISPKSVGSLSQLMQQIGSVLENTFVGKHSLRLFFPEDGSPIVVPPCVVFIDEVHSLKNDIVQGLLKATEANDCLLVTENNFIVNTKNIAWMIATTDRGELFDAFDTRFSKVQLNLYTLDELAQIIQIKNPDWDLPICKYIARCSSRVPREALAFAREVRAEQGMNRSKLEDAVKAVARDNRIDIESGMTIQRLNVLMALYKGPMSAANLSNVAQCKSEELKKFVMPILMTDVEDQKSLVMVSSRGYNLTTVGVDFVKKLLKKRKSM